MHIQQLDYVLILTASPMLGDDSPCFAISYLRCNIYIARHTTVCSGRGHDLANPEPLLTKHEFSLLGAGIYPGVSCSHLQHCSSRICNPESFMLLVRYKTTIIYLQLVYLMTRYHEKSDRYANQTMIFIDIHNNKPMISLLFHIFLLDSFGLCTLFFRFCLN